MIHHRRRASEEKLGYSDKHSAGAQCGMVFKPLGGFSRNSQWVYSHYADDDDSK